MREIRRVNRGHEMTLADRVNENLKKFCMYIKSKRVTREIIGPFKVQNGHLSVEP